MGSRLALGPRKRCGSRPFHPVSPSDRIAERTQPNLRGLHEAPVPPDVGPPCARLNARQVSLTEKGDLIKGLAATSVQRLPGFENLATVAETIPDFFVGAWTILLAPLGTSPAIIRKVHDDMRIVLDDPEIRAKLALNGGFVRHMAPDEVTAFVQNEQKTWRPILEQVAREAQR